MGRYLNPGNEKLGHNILLVGINYDTETKKHTCKIEMLKLNNR